MWSSIKMEHTYDSIVHLLSGILEPMPLNQLGVPDYCRRILAILGGIKHIIQDLEGYYRNLLRSYDITMDEEF